MNEKLTELTTARPLTWLEERRKQREIALPCEKVKALLCFNPETRVFTWKVRASRNVFPGSVAGFINSDGYQTIRINKKNYQSGRLAWACVHGIWPTGVIDHINGLKHDNRIVNLRDVSSQMNSWNLHGATSRSSTGVLGVFPWKGRFRSAIQRKGGYVRRLGDFDTVEEAGAAYAAAKNEVHPGAKP